MPNQVIPLGPRRGNTITADLGFVLFLMSWALFAGLFLVQVAWQSAGGFAGAPRLGVFWLVGSSLCLHVGWRRVRGGRARRLGPWLVSAAFLGMTFVLMEVPRWPQAGAAGRLLGGLLGVHAVAGLMVLGWLGVSERRGVLPPAHRTRARLGVLFWHAIAALGLVVAAMS